MMHALSPDLLSVSRGRAPLITEHLSSPLKWTPNEQANIAKGARRSTQALDI